MFDRVSWSSKGMRIAGKIKFFPRERDFFLSIFLYRYRSASNREMRSFRAGIEEGIGGTASSLRARSQGPFITS